MIALNRALQGPGKRGSLEASNASESKVCLTYSDRVDVSAETVLFTKLFQELRIIITFESELFLQVVEMILVGLFLFSKP